MKTLLLFTLLLCTFTTKATNYYFSAATGDDSRTAAEAQNPATPWQTLGKLNSFFGDLEPGDSVFLNRGETFYGTIKLTKSGTSTLPIFISAYGTGANPVVTGLVPLTWKSAGDDLWVSNEKLDLDALNLVTANGIPAGMGRWPNLDNNNGGYDSIRSSTSNSITDEPGLHDDPSPGKPAYFIGAEIVVRTQRWALDRHPITGYNSSTSTITFDPSSTNERHSNNFGYFIQDDSTILDKKNEWWYNRDNKRLKIYSQQSPTEISAANLQNLLTSLAKSYITIDNITFNGCNADAVSLDDGSHIIIQNCTIKNVGRNGVKTTTPDCSFLNNTMMDLMSKGILINQGAEHTLISHNTFRNVSQIAGAGTSQQEDERSTFSGDGVYIKEKSITIEYNTFIKMGYSAVHLTKVDSVIIRHNFIDTVCNVFDDGGAIYIYTGEAYDNYGREISNNIILHGIGAFFGSGVNGGSAAGAGVAGIYNDRGTSGVVEYSNTVAFFEKGIFQNYGCNRLIITHNTLYNNIKGLQINTRLEDKTRNIHMTNNIAFAAIPSQTTINIYSGDGDALNNFGTIDSNYYARPIKDNITMSWQNDQGSDNIHDVSLSGWQDDFPGYDSHSKKSPRVVTDESQIRFEYNATNTSQTVSLNGSYMDAKGAVHANSIVLKPFTSTVLMQTSDSIQNVAPSVTFTSPAADTSFAASASITISARASDTDGSVAAVDFYNGDNLLGSDSTSPYNFTWNNVAAGNYVLIAKATDNNGLAGSPDSVNVSVTGAVVANVKPTVSLTSPVANATSTAPASINLTADAADSDGTVAVVDFYNGSTLLGSDSTSPYSFTWNNVAAGNYVLIAKANDNKGLAASPDSVNITVTGTDAPSGTPTVSLTSPSANSTFTAPASITITAAAADNGGSVVKVDFYKGVTLLASDSTSPYAFVWSNVASGKYALTAKVTDNAGLTASSDSIRVTVSGNIKPTVSVTSPVANAKYTAPATIIITAAASDSDGTVTEVDFFNGAALLGSDSTSPYSYTWNNVGAGNYSISAKATDNSSLATTSSSVLISVSNINVAPKVSITSPAVNAQFMAPASINITAMASDSGGSITKVEFYNGNTLVGTNKTSPYSITLNNVAPGNYSFTAKATDNSGAFTTSSAVSVTVKPNIAPKVSITSPTANTGFAAPSSIRITATATDSMGSVAKVDFYNGTTLIGTNTTSPYSITLNNVAPGTYSLTAKATDNGGMFTTSAAVAVTVKPNTAPKVSITSPVASTGFWAPASIRITAAASDTLGAVTKVDFYNGSTLIGTNTTSPYSFTWNNVAAGSYSLTAKATDNGGMVTTSAVVAVTVKPNAAPKVSITSPSAYTDFSSPGTINITAAASDSDGTVVKVEFFSGTTLLKTEGTAPYSIVWKDVPVGNYSLTARATDNNGVSTTSAPVNVTVSKFTNAPKVSITSPVTKAGFISPASINITAAASDADGSISKVDFYNGTTLLGTDYTSPYSYMWNKVAPGTYTLTAKATDNKNLATTSAAVTVVVVKPNVPPTVSITSPKANAGFLAPASVTITATATDVDGSVYKVEFYNGTTLLKTEFSLQYTFIWKDVPAGNYSITAKATDNNGAVTVSAAVSISVTKPAVARGISSPGDLTGAGNAGNNLYHDRSKGVNITIGPNPSVNVLSVFTNSLPKNEAVSISVLSMSGALIKTVNANTGSRAVAVDVSSLPAGLYVLKVTAKDVLIYKQFEKQ